LGGAQDESLRQTEALLFLQKKKQKNSYLWGFVAVARQMPAVSRRFLLLFYKKEALPSFLKTPWP
jgi:hypothetical protein